LIDAWFHFLCKNIPLARENGQYQIFDSRFHGNGARLLSNQDHSWLRSAFMLKMEEKCVNLWCFRTPGTLEQRLDSITDSVIWEKAFEDPYTLLVLVLDELISEIHQSIQNLSTVFGAMEYVYSRKGHEGS
jgi:hypothetical protein